MSLIDLNREWSMWYSHFAAYCILLTVNIEADAEHVRRTKSTGISQLNPVRDLRGIEGFKSLISGQLSRFHHSRPDSKFVRRMRHIRKKAQPHEKKWRKRVGVEPAGDRKTCRPPVLKITRDVLMGYESFLFYMISQPLTRRGILIGSDGSRPVLNIELSRFYHSGMTRKASVRSGQCTFDANAGSGHSNAHRGERCRRRSFIASSADPRNKKKRVGNVEKSLSRTRQ